MRSWIQFLTIYPSPNQLSKFDNFKMKQTMKKVISLIHIWQVPHWILSYFYQYQWWLRTMKNNIHAKKLSIFYNNDYKWTERQKFEDLASTTILSQMRMAIIAIVFNQSSVTIFFFLLNWCHVPFNEVSFCVKKLYTGVIINFLNRSPSLKILFTLPDLHFKIMVGTTWLYTYKVN